MQTYRVNIECSKVISYLVEAEDEYEAKDIAEDHADKDELCDCETYSIEELDDKGNTIHCLFM